MKVHELMSELEKVQPESEVFIRKQDGDIYTSIGVSFDDIGDVELYETAS